MNDTANKTLCCHLSVSKQNGLVITKAAYMICPNAVFEPLRESCIPHIAPTRSSLHTTLRSHRRVEIIMQPSTTTLARERNLSELRLTNPRGSQYTFALPCFFVHLCRTWQPEIVQQRTRQPWTSDSRTTSKPWKTQSYSPRQVSRLDSRPSPFANAHHTPRHNVPPPARRMALQAQAKYLGVLPRRHGSLTHPQRHRAQQTTLRSLRLQIHPDSLEPDRRRVPELLLQIHVLSRRPGRDVQAGKRS